MESQTITNILISLPGIVAIFALAYTIFQDYTIRRENFFSEAVKRLSDDSEAVRVASILSLKSLLTSNSFRRGKREQQSAIIFSLSSHLISEKNFYVRSICSEVLIDSNFRMRRVVIKCLYNLNLTLWNNLWNNRNQESEGRENIERDESALKYVNKTLAEILKKRRLGFLDLSGIHLDFSELIDVQLGRCDLSGSTLSHVNFKKTKLAKTIFDRAIIINSYFSENDFKGTSFKGAIVCNCSFGSPENYESLNDSRILYGNNNIELENEIPKNDWLKEIFLTYELDWVGIWVSSQESKNTLEAEWHNPYAENVVLARMVKIDMDIDGNCDVLERKESSDSNDGKYQIQKKYRSYYFDIEYLRGERILVADKQKWEAVKWSIK